MTAAAPRWNRRRALLALLLAGGVAAFFLLGGARYFTLAQAQAAQADFVQLYARQPGAVLAAYFAAYVAVTALSLPGAALMTLLAGAVFGFWTALVLVSFASNLGALLAMLSARYLLRDLVQARFGARLADIDRGIARDGVFYLFTLRLLPVFPFFLVNLLMGLTALPARRYFWVSQLGMLPATAVFVLAGTQLAQIGALGDVLSPGTLAAFTLLGLFPLLARRLLDIVRARRACAPWAHLRPRRYDRNLVVIGAGAAGLVTSYIAAAVKARVTLVEARRMGGDCLNTGCVPSKALLRSAAAAAQARQAGALGVHGAAPRVDFAQVMARVARVVGEIAPHDSVERYRALGVDVQLGQAHILDPWHVQITHEDGRVQRLSTRSIVIATGAQPVLPPLPGLDAVGGARTSDTLWGLRELPRRLLVLGGGPVGCELAQAFARLGSQVTLLEQAPRLLAREDEDVSALARRALEADGVQVLVGHQALRCERLGDEKQLVAVAVGGGDAAGAVRAAGTEHRLAFDELLCAVGRAPRLAGFGLEALGLVSEGRLVVDESLQTRLPHILAAGDVAGRLQFTHVAAHQAWTAAVNGLFGRWKRWQVDERVIPRAVFIDPEVARVGLNLQEAQAQGVACELTRFELAELDRALIDGATTGWVQVLTEPGRDRILGVTIVGAHAGELLAEYVLAMRHGLGLNQVLGTVHSYPTMAEANKYAAGVWKRAHAPQRLLRWMERFHAWQRG